MKVTVLYVGSSLLASLRRAERDIEKQYSLGLQIAAHNCTLPLGELQCAAAERDISSSDIVFVIHVTDSENSARIAAALDRHRPRHHAVIVINCLGDLMRRIRLGDSDLSAIWNRQAERGKPHTAQAAFRALTSWMARARSRAGAKRSPERYLDFVSRLPAVLRYVPSVGKLEHIKHYLMLFCYFLQPTPANIRSMVLYAVKHYVPGHGKRVKTSRPEKAPAMGIYHPEAPTIFPGFAEYRAWYEGRKDMGRRRLDPDRSIGLLLLRPQLVSAARKHYDEVIRALEAEGLSVVPVLSTFMDNREACQTYLVDPASGSPRVSQLLSLTGFSFVGGPAMNDSAAAASFLKSINCPLRSAVSLETQTVEQWAGSMIGLNPVQVAMQVAIPEVDGATEPFLFGGFRAGRDEPEPLRDRCHRIARRISRWNRLHSLPRSEVRLSLLIYCFPPNKGNLGTAAGLDVFPSLLGILRRLAAEGYSLDVPANSDALRMLLLEGKGTGAPQTGYLANVAYRLSAEEYFRLCPYVEEIEAEWGPAPGRINAEGGDILIHGVCLGNVFIGIQPTFGYEGDPMRLLMAKGSAPHHGFMGLYTYLEKVFHADAIVHVGTHGALEFMPGKQAALSSSCWPDRLIGEFPNIYVYSVNNPSEGTIAKRRSYAELVSYLTPPVESAGLYKELTALKETIGAYRQCLDQNQKDHLYSEILASARNLHLHDELRKQ